MINKCKSASGYNIYGTFVAKIGVDTTNIIYNTALANNNFNSADRIYNQDFAPTGWHYNAELDDQNGYIFTAATFGCALSEVTFFGDAGVNQVSVNGHSSGSYHTIKPGETLSVDGFITTIWANNLAASGTSILRAFGMPVIDITKMP